jgi:transcriptional regulator with XRE-family HTH domain
LRYNVLKFIDLAGEMVMASRLGEELSRLRQVKDRSLSLREVERQTGISNEYLSQLERGIATKPAPDLLQKLAKFYEVPYESLLIAAGYLKERSTDQEGRVIPRDIETVARSAQFSGAEWKEVREFMTFVAGKRRRKSE